MSLGVLAAASELRPVAINDLALNTTLYYAADLSYVALDIGLSCALFGVLTLLVIVAAIFLFRKGLGYRPVKILLPSTLLLYGSTALYMASLASHVGSVNRLAAQAQAGLFSDAYTNADVDAFEADVLKQSWMMTIALGLNLIVGDSIVWWRVCAVWKNRVVYTVGPLLIVLIFGFGVKALSGVHACVDPCKQPQLLLQDGFFVNACAALSLALNLLATALIGYKAWVHRRLLRGHFGCGRRKSRVLKALALLVESGTVYCLLLIIVVVYEASAALFAAPDVRQNAFLRTVADYTYACFIPVIAIYPVLIIVIVALNWSPIDHGLTRTDGTHLAGEDGACAPTRVTLNRATMSTVVIADSIQMRCVQDGDSEAGMLGAAETKRRPEVIV
ncbi:hypothetical protein GSI_11120 [Ganoderma sinense ZZ0214-1]|uniref:Uncharacterized protein n=1 Tax=Ganoderma sinense ZZ0214-1 TaxID=1077348 RepID=A0A2G8RZ73_9APHY|nr:hypothetical protein GSI_11120 [Ganoderma sinense ZZ0214-1]